jgi:hypothetical protein
MDYVLSGYVLATANITKGYFGVRDGSNNVIKEVQFGSLPSYTNQTVSFNSGSNSTVSIYVGYWGPGADSWINFGDVTLR